tara:strand:+ start:30 stop:743 length:714 start_codon:yes stop_codon:yes gene_type:complete
MLSVNKISKTIKDKKILNNVSFNVNFGNICGLLGPNGAGKTSSFYIIAGLTTSNGGQIQLAGEDVTNMPMHKRSKLGIKYLPQEPSIFQNLTVYENLLGLAELTFSSKDKIKKFIEESVEEFGLKNICDLKGRQLSGGQRRKVEIARTLVSNPRMILLDEPFAGIDPIAIEDIKSVLRKLKSKNIGILITDHNVRETLELCDNAAIINSGEIIAYGTKEDLISNKKVREVYLGNMYK